jgi:hypothetical protein
MQINADAGTAKQFEVIKVQKRTIEISTR